MRWPLVALLAACAGLALADDIPADQRLSGFEMMGPETQAMQRDDFANPATLFVKQGEALFGRAPASGKPACSGCHAEGAMRGVAARYPAQDAASGQVVDLPGRIGLCQSRHQESQPAARESADLLALEAFIARQSRGMPIEPPLSRGLAANVTRGEALYRQRLGQLDLSCAQCHSQNWGRSLGGTKVPQAHPTGYPIFRLEWQGMGSLQRRFRNCLTGVRAEPFPYGAPEWTDLEVYLKQRAAGMTVDAPGLRP